MSNTHKFFLLTLVFLFFQTQKIIAQPFSLYLGDDITIPCAEKVEIEPVLLTGDIASYNYFTSPNTNLHCSTCNKLYIEVSETTTIFLEVTDTQGETLIDSMTVRIEKEDQVFIPNIFTPNGDGHNDYFNVFTGHCVELILEIYIWNRNMQLIYTKELIDPYFNTLDEGWDGKLNGTLLNPGAYVYAVRVRYTNGKTETFYGDVLLFL